MLKEITQEQFDKVVKGLLNKLNNNGILSIAKVIKPKNYSIQKIFGQLMKDKPEFSQYVKKMQKISKQIALEIQKQYDEKKFDFKKVKNMFSTTAEYFDWPFVFMGFGMGALAYICFLLASHIGFYNMLFFISIVVIVFSLVSLFQIGFLIHDIMKKNKTFSEALEKIRQLGKEVDEENITLKREIENLSIFNILNLFLIIIVLLLHSYGIHMFSNHNFFAVIFILDTIFKISGTFLFFAYIIRNAKISRKLQDEEYGNKNIQPI